MNVIVCGGRDFVNVPLLWRVLDQMDAEAAPVGIRLVIDGASDDVTGPYQGADYWAHQWAVARNKPTLREHAEWKKHGRAAGPIRNGVMLKHGPDRLVAFAGGRGTTNMINQAESAGVPVSIVTG